MTFIQPTRERYDPSRDLTEPGSYWMKCIAVEQGQPHWKHRGKFQIVFRFQVEDDRFPKLRGKVACIIAQETVYVDPDGKPSHLITHAKNMGWKEPENGFDPQEARGNIYFCRVEHHGGRLYVTHAMRGPDPAAKTPAKPVKPAPTHDTPPIDGEPITSVS